VPAAGTLRKVLGSFDPDGECPAATQGAVPDSLESVQRATEIEHIRASLRVHGGNRAAAARALGISRTTLWRKIRSS